MVLEPWEIPLLSFFKHGHDTQPWLFPEKESGQDQGLQNALLNLNCK